MILESSNPRGSFSQPAISALVTSHTKFDDLGPYQLFTVLYNKLDVLIMSIAYFFKETLNAEYFYILSKIIIGMLGFSLHFCVLSGACYIGWNLVKLFHTIHNNIQLGQLNV